jgi:cell division protein FtsB
MGLFGTKKEDTHGQGIEGFPPIASAPEGNQPSTPSPASQVRGSLAPAHVPARFGVDHAIGLIRSLPTDENLDLVVKVLKTTLESLGIRIADIVADAAQRQEDLKSRVGQLQSEIDVLETEIQKRTKQIEQLDAAHVEASKVRSYLEGDAQLTPAEGVGRLPRI